ncbi:MAG TPA: phosphate acyltransferase, partial [Limnochordia bacterium]
EVSGRTIAELKTVISGAGAAAIACAEFLIALGLPPENLTLVDSKGVIYQGREEGMNPFKAAFARDTAARTLADAVRGADFFLGLSVAGALEPDMLASMAERPIVFALANPDPEIDYELARRVRPDAIVATGRSDYPNQVNNVLGFPFIFRGALDVRARTINEEMKIAAARALAELARTDVPDSVLKAYNLDRLAFGPEYLIPKPLDPRVLLAVAPAVAQAAMATGVARQTIDLDAYRANLERRFGKAREIKRMLIERARSRPQRVVFAEGEEPRIIRAAAIVQEEGIGHPVLIGRPERVAEQCAQMGLPRLDVVWPDQDPRLGTYIDVLWRLRQRKGVTRREAERLMRRPYYFGAMMVRRGDGDALVGGLTSHYPDVLRPALEVIQTAPGVRRVAGMYVMIVRDQTFFFTDATVNIAPSAEELADIAILAADTVSALGFEPHIAMLSFSNFGSTRHPLAEKVRQAVEIVAARRPDLEIDGEMQADTAVVPEIRETEYPFSRLRGQANVLVFPDLEAANIAYKLLQRLGGAEAIGPVLMGMGRSVHVLQRGDRVEEIVNVAAMAVVDAQRRG